MVGSSWVNTVLVCDDLPELGTDLVSALASLDVHKLAHGCKKLEAKGPGLSVYYLRAAGKRGNRNMPRAKSVNFSILQGS